MIFFFGYTPGIFFILLGPFIILGGVRRPKDRARLVRSGVGSIIVGLGNLLIPHNWAVGLAVIALGIYVIVTAAKVRY